jgi:hypothetical protein
LEQGEVPWVLDVEEGQAAFRGDAYRGAALPPVSGDAATGHETQLFPLVVDERQPGIFAVAVQGLAEAALKGAAEVQHGVLARDGVEPVPSSRVTHVHDLALRLAQRIIAASYPPEHTTRRRQFSGSLCLHHVV